MCKLTDIQWLEDQTVFFSINEIGDPVGQQDHTEIGDFRCYLCNGCGEEFKDAIHKSAWVQVKEHINEN